MGAFETIFGVAGIVLQILLLFLLIRGPLGRYFPLFLYVLSATVTSAVEGWVLRTYPVDSPQYFNVYWGDDIFLNGLLFLMVIPLTSRALEGHPLQKTAPRLMALIAFVTVLLPFVAFQSPIWSHPWNNSFSQLLSFGAAVMTLVLWTAMIASRRRDHQLLTVSAGLGLALASAAATFGVRSGSVRGSVLLALADWAHVLFQVGAVGLWCWAFWPHKKPVPAEEPSEQRPRASV